MKLWRAERGLILALVVVGSVVAACLRVIDGVQLVAVLTLCVQAVVTYKAMTTTKES